MAISLPQCVQGEIAVTQRLWIALVCHSKALLEAKFHYASWFGAGSKLVRAEIWPIV